MREVKSLDSRQQTADSRCNRLICEIIIFVASLCFLLLFSSSTRPGSPDPIAGDQAMFMTIGKYWAKGVLPYVGLWDSKGPIIFFINALGYLIFGSKTGIFIIQLICLTVSLVLAFKILRLKLSSKLSMIFTMLTLLFLSLVHAVDSVEEYTLPLLMLSFYCILKWLILLEQTKKVKFFPKYGFVLGLTFSFCLLTRVTDAVGICAVVLVIAIYLVYNRLWLNLVQNAIAALAGIALLLFPFIIYFSLYGALFDFFYGTILYNLSYAGNASFNSNLSLEIIIGYSPSCLLLFVGIFNIFKKRYIKSALYLLVGLLTLLVLIKSYHYLHYGMIAIPYIPIVICEVYENIRKDGRIPFVNVKKRTICICFVAVLAIVSFGLAAKETFLGYQYEHFLRYPHGDQIDPIDVELELCEKNIPKEEKNSFVAYNCKDGIYLYLDICPYYRFFTMQDWAAQNDTTLTDSIKETYYEGDCKWILTQTYGDQDIGIQEVLDSKYDLMEESDVPSTEISIKLYRISE